MSDGEALGANDELLVDGAAVGVGDGVSEDGAVTDIEAVGESVGMTVNVTDGKVGESNGVSGEGGVGINTEVVGVKEIRTCGAIVGTVL